MKTVLITGANKSIGFEVARQMLQQGFYVFLGSRSLENGQKAVELLQSEGMSNVMAIEIDVTDDISVKAARIEIGKKTDVLDVLINNAGITGGQPQQALAATPEQFKKVFDTNVIGVARVTQAFIDLVKNHQHLAS
jgi:NAD(P)-dependent dehydrogenase (short-subunit alcohol dehydrogenase family)